MHWLDRFIDDVLKLKVKEHVVESGISISGSIHIGNLCDLIYADDIRGGLNERGYKAECLWVADDYDPLDSIPYPVSRSGFKRYLGMPYTRIPDPFNCCGSWASHFTNEFLDSLKVLNIEPLVKSGEAMYKDGTYTPLIRIALREAGKIRRIFKDVSGAEKSSDWLPYMPICGECGRIGTTRAYEFDGDKVLYSCDLKTGYAEGCGYKGEVDVKDGLGKLTWRVEWAARWAAFNVTIEPFGKDHAAAGGSYDTCKHIVKEVYGKEPPIPLVFEHVMLDGMKMSKSKGRIFTPSQWFEIAPPETLKFFLLKLPPKRHKNFKVWDIHSLVNEYYRAERIYFKVEEAPNVEIQTEYSRSYELSQVKAAPSRLPIQIPYDFMASIAQIAPDNMERVIEILRRTGHVQGSLTKEDIALIKDRFIKAKTWLNKYAPKEAKFTLLQDASTIRLKLNEKQKEALSKVAEVLETKEWRPQELNSILFETPRRLGLNPPDFFKAAYLALIGKESGPWLANFILTLGCSLVAKRFKEASS